MQDIFDVKSKLNRGGEKRRKREMRPMFSEGKFRHLRRKEKKKGDDHKRRKRRAVTDSLMRGELIDKHCEGTCGRSRRTGASCRCSAKKERFRRREKKKKRGGTWILMKKRDATSKGESPKA